MKHVKDTYRKHSMWEWPQKGSDLPGDLPARRLFRHEDIAAAGPGLTSKDDLWPLRL